MKKTILALLCLTLALLLCSCCLSHEWADATCETPKTCTKCGETEGEALGHTWQDADCVTPKTCSVCQETKGEALGHTWQDATCDTAKTCSVCQQTEGEPLNHEAGEWVQISTDPVTATISQEQPCALCGTILETDTVAMETMVGDGLFLLTPQEFMDRFSAIARENGAAFQYERVTSGTAFQILINGDSAIVQFFGNDTAPLPSSAADSHELWCVSLISYGESDATLRRCFIMSCDPTLDLDAAFITDVVIMAEYLNYAAAGEIIGYYEEHGLLYETAYLTAEILNADESMEMLNIYASDFR